jgi:Spy/CpxP family protein refolding chaperone
MSPMKRLLILSVAAALALSAAAAALANGPGAHGPGGRVGAFGLGRSSGDWQPWRDCLAKQGLPARPARGSKLSDADKAKLKAAFEACKSALPAPVQAAQGAFAKFRDCIQKQGAPAKPAPGTKLSDADKAKWKAAFQACLPAPVKAAQGAFAKYRDCLKQQGLPARPARGSKLSDADKAKVKDAFAKCKSLLPVRPDSTSKTTRFG